VLLGFHLATRATHQMLISDAVLYKSKEVEEVEEEATHRCQFAGQGHRRHQPSLLSDFVYKGKETIARAALTKRNAHLQQCSTITLTR